MQDSGFATDCQLGPPILTKPCLETVDKRMCKLSPTGIALLGMETWTATVMSPGNDAGISCLDAASEISKRRKSNLDDPVVSCDGHGLCQEERPCQLTCAQVQKASEVEPLAYIPDGHLSSCGGNTEWSACDYGCRQTKIASAVFSDGICREVSRESRACHMGACSRSDPCRVPFIVHVVLAFRDGSVSNWSLAAEEILASALVSTVHQELNEDDDGASGTNYDVEIFTVGDVNVVTALPWYQDDNDSDKSDQKLGLKVVVEIAMFNPLADVTNKTIHFDETDEAFSETQLNSALRNLTDLLTGRKRPVLCVPEELYPLAKRALQVKKIMEESYFVPSLVDELKVTGDRYDRSAFGPIHSTTYDPTTSRVLSVWTIRTGIEDEINFFGPTKPIAAKLISFLQSSIVLSAVFFIILTVWSCVLALHEYLTGRRRHHYHHHYHYIYYLLPSAMVTSSWLRGSERPHDPDDPFELEDSIIMGGGGGDFPPRTKVHQESSSPSNINTNFRMTTPKKRPKRTYSSLDSSDA